MLLDNIKELCARKKMNISTLEKKAGLSNGTIGKWDKASPQLDSVVKVAEALNVKVDALIRLKHQGQEAQ